MALLEPTLNIRVSAVAPGVVKTPIWAEDKLKWVDESADTWITGEKIANVMLDLVQKEEYPGGTVLEVGAERLRKVAVLNDPGNGSDKGLTVGNVGKGVEEVFGLIEEQFGK